MHPALEVSLVVPAAGVCWFAARRIGRLRYYRRLAASRDAIVTKHGSRLRLDGDTHGIARQFAQESLIRTRDVLTPVALAQLQGECKQNRARVERSYVPLHKKGGTLCYERVHLHAPACLALYHSPQLRTWISRVVGEPVYPTADHDQSSCSLLYYDEVGDHIHWHFDHNFYRGRHFTVLVSLMNRGPHGLSSGMLERKDRDGNVVQVDTRENTLVVFEGKQVRHRASPIDADETRIMLSMTFGTNPQIGWGWEMLRRVKDTAYFGPRVLWE